MISKHRDNHNCNSKQETFEDYNDESCMIHDIASWWKETTENSLATIECIKFEVDEEGLFRGEVFYSTISEDMLNKIHEECSKTVANRSSGNFSAN